MKATKRNRSIRVAIISMFLCISLGLMAQNTVQKVANVTSNMELSTATDLVITATANAVTGTINITNPDAVIIFENIKPSKVISDYADNITINGNAWNLNANVLASIYRHGTMVIPHGKAYNALTVYTEENFGGESRDTYLPNNYYKSLGTFDNAIRSFKLKRGYMVTMATATDGGGYSRVFIANDGDLEVPVMQKELSGKVSFFRIFRWQWPSKKGYAGGDGTDNDLLNTTWFYTWGAGENARVDREFVPQRHHETGVANNGEQKWAWPSWSEINGRDETVPHLLGQNEPDNTGVTAGEVNMSVEEVVALQKPFLESGMRIGTPATCNPNSWIPNFVAQCKAKNLRVDYVAVHWYKGGQNPNNFINDLKWLHEQTGLPIWVTEWNNGANWTGESGFPLANGSWQSWSDNMTTSQQRNALWMKDVLDLLNKAPYVERYAIYNAVEEKRYVVNYHQNPHFLTEAGKVYSDYKADFAYNPNYGYVMTWNHIAPKNFVATYTSSRTKKELTLTWTNENGEQTNKTYIEQENADGTWTPIDSLLPTETVEMSVTYDMGTNPAAGMRNYRIRNLDSDGRSRYTNESSISIGGVVQSNIFQYGTLEIANTDNVNTYFTNLSGGTTAPAIFAGMPSFNNTGMGINGQIYGVATSQFKFKFMPWTKSYTTDMTQPEEIDMLIVDKGSYTFGDMKMVVDAFPSNIGQDTLAITFATPFDEGVTPIVFAATQPLTITSLAYPVNLAVFDVTNTGFKVKATRQAGVAADYPGFLTQKAVYMAVTPGEASIGNGKKINAGIATEKIGGSTARTITLKDTEGQQLQLVDANIWTAPQTHNLDVATLFRIKNYFTTNITNEDGETEIATTGISIIRQADKTANPSRDIAAATGDYIGWFTISKGEDIVDHINEIPSAEQMQIKVSNRSIVVTNNPNAKIYTITGVQIGQGTPLQPGIYMVNNGKKESVKVFIK